MRKVLIADDHPLVREALARVLRDALGAEVCALSEDVEGTLEATREFEPDLVVLDLHLRDGLSVDAIPEIRRASPGTRVVIITLEDDLYFAERALRCGAHGFATKSDPMETLVEACRRVLAGEVFVSERLRFPLLERMLDQGVSSVVPLQDLLSEKEMTVFRFVGDGMGPRDIARHAKLSVQAVERSRARLRQKIGLPDAAALTRYAMRWVEFDSAADSPSPPNPTLDDPSGGRGTEQSQ